MTWHVPDPERIGAYEDDLLGRTALYIKVGGCSDGPTDRSARNPSRSRNNSSSSWNEFLGFSLSTSFCPSSRASYSKCVPTRRKPFSLSGASQPGEYHRSAHPRSGPGKTITAITDARRLNGRTLFAVHTRELAHQARAAFHKVWPEVTTGLFLDNVREYGDLQPCRHCPEPRQECGTIRASKISPI